MSAPNPWEGIGLPPTWVPSPVSWRIARIEAITPAGRVHQHVLIMDCVTGTMAVAFDDDGVRRLVDALTEARTGIALATSVPLHVENGRAP